MTQETLDRIWENVQIDDLPPDMQEVARACGMETVRYLVTEWGGLQLYAPAARTATRPAKERMVRKEWNARNEGELAKRYDLSRKEVYDALRGPSGVPVPPTQRNMFEADEDEA